METHPIRISDIIIATERLRALQPAAIQTLADSIRDIGLRTPITVRMVNGKPHLVTGEHRIEAMKANGKTDIDAVVFDNERDARIWAIDENLQRADLKGLERAHHMTARAELIAQRARERTPMPDQRFAIREDAKAAGAKIYYPDEPCAKGHNDGRYVSINKCVTCQREANSSWRGGDNKPANNSQVNTGGRGRTGGNSAAARELGVSKDTIRTAKMIDKLSERAKQEAINLGLANKHHSLKYAAAHCTAELQVKALQSEAKKLAAREERRRLGKLTIAEQAAAAAPPRAIPTIDHRHEAAGQYWLWLIEEFGEKAYQIVNRLRELHLPSLFEAADRAKPEGNAAPKPSLH